MWSQFVDGYHIAKVDDHSSIMVMHVLDSEAMEAFMTNDHLRAWDAEHGCVDAVYTMDKAQ